MSPSLQRSQSLTDLRYHRLSIEVERRRSLPINSKTLQENDIDIQNNVQKVDEIATKNLPIPAPEPPPPVQSHEIKPIPVHHLVTKYKKTVQGEVHRQKVDLPRRKDKDEAALKSAAIFNSVLFGAVVIALIIAVVAAIVFLPPLGIAIVGIAGAIAIIAVSTYGVTNLVSAYDTAKFSKQQVEKAKANIGSLEECAKLFDKYPNKGDGTSFEEFLDGFDPPDEGFKIKDLENYATLFQKKTKARLLRERERIQEEIEKAEEHKARVRRENKKEDIDKYNKQISDLNENLSNCQREIRNLTKAPTDDIKTLEREISGLDRLLRNPEKKETGKVNNESEPIQLPGDVQAWLWDKKPPELHTYPINLADKNTVYTFGNHAHKRHDWAKKALEHHGHSEEEYAFLSNSYSSPDSALRIDGEYYRTLIHYLLAKEIRKTRQNLDISDILNAPTAAAAIHAAKRKHYIQNLEIDDEILKRALFFKFVQEDGKTPTPLGEKLMKTQDKALIAGYEPFVSSLGAEFTNQDCTEMKGQNKLGMHLEFIRGWLLKQNGP